MKRLLLLVAALLACGLIAAGCGDDDDDNGDDTPVATETAPADTTAADTTAETTESEDTPDTSDEATEAAIEACKEGVQTSGSQLSEELRNDLEDICEEAAGGDEEDIREASLEICKKIVEESLPEGAGREQGIEACESSVTP